jgi:hypothetical protein
LRSLLPKREWYGSLNIRVYHKEGERWYGKSKKGKFMSESDGQKAGFRAAKMEELKKERNNEHGSPRLTGKWVEKHPDTSEEQHSSLVQTAVSGGAEKVEEDRSHRESDDNNLRKVA